MKSRILISIYISMFLMVLFGLIVYFPGCQEPPKANTVTIDLSQAVALSKSNNISDVLIDSNKGLLLLTAQTKGEPVEIRDAVKIPLTLINGTQLSADMGAMSVADLKEMGFLFPANYSVVKKSGTNSEAISSVIIALVPLLVFFLIMFMFLRMAGRASGGPISDFSRSKAWLARANYSNVTFADVAGIPEAKQDLQEIVDFLQNRQKFQRLGARVPKGVLLIGPPGTGKTLLAKAVAGEAIVPFFSISGSEFVEVFVGVGASRVRDLFQQAKSRAPAIIFIDEIDAVGRKRLAGAVTSHEEREQTLNQILSEMDGFTPNSGVIVLAATNRVDVLDPALLRPGRFDRRVTLGNPDTEERKAILAVHIKGKPLDDTIHLDILAKQTAGFSGADLANLVNEAAIMAARKNKASISIDEFGEAIDRVIAGPAKKNRVMSFLDKKRVAYHEAGHALAAHLLPEADPVFKVSIVSRGSLGGYTRTLPEQEHYFMTKGQLQASLATLLAGYAAEEIVFGQVSTGPHDDIFQATNLARKMIMDYSMGDKLSLRTFGIEESNFGFGQKDYSEQFAGKIDSEVDTLINEARDSAKKILTGNRARLIHLATKLMEMENLESTQLQIVFSEPIDDNGNQIGADLPYTSG
jgi:cell division protease FtsH